MKINNNRRNSRKINNVNNRKGKRQRERQKRMFRVIAAKGTERGKKNFYLSLQTNNKQNKTKLAPKGRE